MIMERDSQISIEKLQTEMNKYAKKIKSIEEEGIVQMEKEIEQKKELLRDLDKQLKLTKEGKDGNTSAIDSIKKSISEAENEL